MAVASITRVKKVVNALVNTADSYTETPADNRLYDQELSDVALTIDGELICIGLNNPTWAHRIAFQSSASVAHAANLPDHIGPIDAVLIGGQPASPAPLDQIATERALLTAGVTELTPHYNADGTVLFHNGSSSATVKYCNYTRTTALQLGEEYEGAIIRGTASVVSSPEGENPEMQGEFRNQYMVDKQMMASGQVPPPYQA